MKRKHNKQDGEGSNVHPEHYGLRKQNHEGLISIRFANHSYSADSVDAEVLREKFCGLLMYNIRQKWKIRELDWEWTGCSEFGGLEEGHCHIIFTFDPMKRNSKRPPTLDGFEEFACESAEHIRKSLGLPRNCIDLNWRPANDQGFVDYFCKKEPGREDYKHFFKSPASTRFGELVLEEIQEDEELERLRQEDEERILDQECDATDESNEEDSPQ